MSIRASHVRVDKDSELGRALEAARASGEPVVVEVGDHSYEFTPCERANDDIWENYDPERVLKALQASAGALAGVDTEKLKRDLREQRGHRVRRRSA